MVRDPCFRIGFIDYFSTMPQCVLGKLGISMMFLVRVFLATAAWLAVSLQAQAAVIVNSEQVGADVVFTYSGTLNVSGLRAPYGNSSANSGYIATTEPFFLAQNSSTTIQTRDFVFNGTGGSVVGSIGPPGSSFSNGVATGTPFFFYGPSGSIGLPTGYQGDPTVGLLDNISGELRFANKDFGDLGLTPESTWVGTFIDGDGINPNNDTITWNVGSVPAPVPEVSATGSLAAFASIFGFMLLLLERRRGLNQSDLDPDSASSV